MKKVYVAGAYSADNVLDVLKNIGRGEEMCTRLFLMGYAPFCPWHDKDFVLRNPNADFTVDMFYEYSMVWLEACDCALVIPLNMEGSHGTQKEIKRAEKLGMPVYYSLGELQESGK